MAVFRENVSKEAVGGICGVSQKEMTIEVEVLDVTPLDGNKRELIAGRTDCEIRESGKCSIECPILLKNGIREINQN